MLPSGSLRLWTTLATQPIVKMSSGRGSSTDASCCAARKIRLSLRRACSSARVDDGRPITNGIIMWGNTTTSRSGTIGRVSYTSNGVSTLTGLLDQRNRFVLGHDHFARDGDLSDLLLVRHLIHEIEHQVLDDHSEAARADLAFERRFRNRLERVVREAELDVLVLEQLLVLTRDCVARLREDLEQGGLVQFVQRADDRQAADEFGDQAVLDQVLRLELFERRADVAPAQRFHVGLESQRLLAHAPLDLLVETDKRAAADEE